MLDLAKANSDIRVKERRVGELEGQLKAAVQQVADAKKKGAQQAEAFVEVGRQSSCRVRDGQIEDLTQATSKGVGLRVLKDRRLGFAYTSDFQDKSLESFVDRALQLHGGYGYIKDFPIERHLRDLRVHRILEGTNEIMRVIIARRLLRERNR